MHKIIAIIIGCFLTLAVTSHAADKVDPAAAKKQKSKAPAPKQQFAPNQHAGPKTHVQTRGPQHINKPVHTNVNTVQQHPARYMVRPPNTPNSAPMVQSKKVQTSKQQQQFQTRQP